MSEQVAGGSPPELVLDTSVAVKFHVPEEHHQKARQLQGRFEEGTLSLLAPGTVLPEIFNAFWQKHRRKELTLEEVRQGWELISELPLALYAPEDLMPRAVDIAFETSIIVYDALFLALAEDAETVVITADDRLLKALEGTAYSNLARPLTALPYVVPIASFADVEGEPSSASAALSPTDFALRPNITPPRRIFFTRRLE